MKNWTLIYDGFEPAEEGHREALCTLGNGYFATRGAAAESEADDIHYPGTYLAGGYNRLETEIAGRTIENEDLVNLPNWLVLKFKIEDENWFDVMSVELLSYRQELNLQHGVLTRTICFRDKKKRETTIIDRRFVHRVQMHLAAQEITVIPENWSGRIQFQSALDGTVINAGVERYKQLNSKHLDVLDLGRTEDDLIWLLTETNQSHIRIAEAARTDVFVNEDPVIVEKNLVQQAGWIGQEFVVQTKEKTPVSVQKTISLFTSRDVAISEPLLDAIDALRTADDFQTLLESHITKWKHTWDRCDIEIIHNTRTQMILRLHIFHLLQTASRNSIDLDIGVPARGWHGEAYRGHIFWDELFIFPYLNLRLPMLTCSLLRYRFRRLDRARLAARQAGFKGAMYPWQSGSNGREETQQLHLNPQSGRWLPDNTHLQRHVNAAIVYNVWLYYKTTKDLEFLASCGAEMALEIARFMADLTTYNEALDRYEILGVMGPDEYHDAYPDSDKPGLNNNAYTNVMTVFVLRTAIQILELLPLRRRRDLQELLGLDMGEIDSWRDMIRKMRLVFHDDGILSQFEGYDRLQEFDWDGYRQKYGDIHRLDRILEKEGDSVNRYKASKQPDVLMLFYLFSAEEIKSLFNAMGYDFDPEMIPKNIEYYLNRSSHGSTLSYIVFCWVMARSDRRRSWEMFQKALEADVSDVQGGTTREGIHLGAMAGTVDILQRCYTGLAFEDEMLALNPRIPHDIEKLCMKIKYHNRWIDIATTPGSMTIASDSCELNAVKFRFQDKVYELRPGQKHTFALD
ncbi:MAG TPA: glycoside hydrolase family 65 protein [Phycisphaerales bacterium]|nr:glycoside hydrolase family 65 protein [Phycisphaerales bacterium]